MNSYSVELLFELTPSPLQEVDLVLGTLLVDGLTPAT